MAGRRGRSLRASYISLILENICSLGVELIGMPVDQLQLALVRGLACGCSQAVAQDALDCLRAVLTRARDVVERLHDVFRKCDRRLQLHTTIVLPPRALLRRSRAATDTASVAELEPLLDLPPSESAMGPELSDAHAGLPHTAVVPRTARSRVRSLLS